MGYICIYLRFLIVKSQCSSLNLMSVGLIPVALGKSRIFFNDQIRFLGWLNDVKSPFLLGENPHCLVKSPSESLAPRQPRRLRRSQHRRSQDVGVIGLASAGSRGGQGGFHQKNMAKFWWIYDGKTWIYDLWWGKLMVDLWFNDGSTCQLSRNLWWIYAWFKSPTCWDSEVRIPSISRLNGGNHAEHQWISEWNSWNKQTCCLRGGARVR